MSDVRNWGAWLLVGLVWGCGGGERASDPPPWAPDDVQAMLDDCLVTSWRIDTHGTDDPARTVGPYTRGNLSYGNDADDPSVVQVAFDQPDFGLEPGTAIGFLADQHFLASAVATCADGTEVRYDSPDQPSAPVDFDATADPPVTHPPDSPEGRLDRCEVERWRIQVVGTEDPVEFASLLVDTETADLAMVDIDVLEITFHEPGLGKVPGDVIPRLAIVDQIGFFSATCTDGEVLRFPT